MQKSDSYFDAQTGKIVHRNVEKKTMENGTEKRTDKKVRIDFLGADGAAHKHPVEGCRAIRVNYIQTGESEPLVLGDLTEDMIYRLAAFGASTLARNEVNTLKLVSEGGEGTIEEAYADCAARLEGFRQNSYRSVSSGSATPLILLAFERAMKARGSVPEETIAAKLAEFRAKWDGGEDDKARAKNRKEIGKILRGVSEVRAAEKEIREEREALRAERAPQASLDSLLG